MEKLTKKQVMDAYEAEGTLQEIGYRLNISPAHVGCIKRGVSHRDVTGATPPTTSRKVLSEETIRKIAEHTGTVRAVAAEMGIAESTVKKYRKPGSYRFVGKDGRFAKRPQAEAE